jgi:hypothetical protein
MRHLLMATAVLAASSAGSSFAQEEAGQFRTAVSVVGGLSVGSSQSFRLGNGRGALGGFGGGGSDTGFAVGGSVAHDVSSRITLEATGLYLDRNASAWSADAGVRLNLTPSRESIVPYFAVSGGLYGQSRQTVGVADIDRLDDFRDGRGFGPGGPAPFGGGRGQGQPVTPIGRGDLPTLTTSRSSSTDGMLTLGGGVNFAAGPHVFVRPDARAQLVFAGDNRVLGLFTINFGYRF